MLHGELPANKPNYRAAATESLVKLRNLEFYSGLLRASDPEAGQVKRKLLRKDKIIDSLRRGITTAQEDLATAEKQLSGIIKEAHVHVQRQIDAVQRTGKQEPGRFDRADEIGTRYSAAVTTVFNFSIALQSHQAFLTTLEKGTSADFERFVNEAFDTQLPNKTEFTR